MQKFLLFYLFQAEVILHKSIPLIVRIIVLLGWLRTWLLLLLRSLKLFALLLHSSQQPLYFLVTRAQLYSFSQVTKGCMKLPGGKRTKYNSTWHIYILTSTDQTGPSLGILYVTSCTHTPLMCPGLVCMRQLISFVENLKSSLQKALQVAKLATEMTKR